jgi:signal peptidase I
MTMRESDEEAGPGAGYESEHDFDPLLSPWHERDEATRSFAFDEWSAAAADDTWGQPARRSSDDDDLWWTPPAAAPYSAPASAPYRAERPPEWYPGRSYDPYREPLTDLQRQLQQGTITLPHPQRRWLVTVREVAETLLLALLIFLAVRASFQNFKVEGHSMDPSLANGEYLIVNKLNYAQIDLSIFNFLPFYSAGDDPIHYLWGSPDRGDVIVFRAPNSPDRDFIKRIIGLPGDTVEIDENTGQVKVNGAPLAETYIQGTTSCSQECSWTVPPSNTDASQEECGSNSCYFVLGDNRQNSSDSRQGWMVPKENIVGKALITYWNEGSPEIHFAPNHSVGITDEASAEQ